MSMMKIIIFSVMLNAVAGQGAGNGISKSTYSANEALTGLNFLLKYLPVTDADDSCDNDVCTCVVDGESYEVQQGRVALDTTSNGKFGVSPGFGLHLVNCSTNTLGGGMTTEQVEDEFAAKLGDMTKYDQFMDYNVALLTTDLDAYAASFSSGGVPYLPIEWVDQETPYYGIIVHVPTSQMVLEIMAKNSSATAVVAAHPNLWRSSEKRAPSRALARAEAELLHRAESRTSAGSAAAAEAAAATTSLAALVVNRAASSLSAVDEFYSTGMQLTTTLDDTSSNGVSKKCYLWPSATVDVCFTARSGANATSTDFSVQDFEDMLNSAHDTVVTGGTTCNNKWMDNHYAFDDQSGSFDYIVTYIQNTPGTYYYCESSSSLWYIVDPTGWGIQLDVNINTASSICGSSTEATSSGSFRKLLQGPPPTDDHGGGGDMCPCTGMTSCGVS